MNTPRGAKPSPPCDVGDAGHPCGSYRRLDSPHRAGLPPRSGGNDIADQQAAGESQSETTTMRFPTLGIRSTSYSATVQRCRRSTPQHLRGSGPSSLARIASGSSRYVPGPLRVECQPYETLSMNVIVLSKPDDFVMMFIEPAGAERGRRALSGRTRTCGVVGHRFGRSTRRQNERDDQRYDHRTGSRHWRSSRVEGFDRCTPRARAARQLAKTAMAVSDEAARATADRRRRPRSDRRGAWPGRHSRERPQHDSRTPAASRSSPGAERDGGLAGG